MDVNAELRLPPDTVDEVGRARQDLVGARKYLDAVEDALIEAGKVVASGEWSGQAADAALAAMAKLRIAVANSASQLAAAARALDQYCQELAYSLVDINVARLTFQQNGLGNKTELDAGAVFAGIKAMYDQAHGRVVRAAGVCRVVLDGVVLDRSGLFESVTALPEVPMPSWLDGDGGVPQIEFVAQVEGLSDEELNAWLDQASAEELARLAGSLPGWARTALINALLSRADPLLLGKVLAAFPDAQPDPRGGIGWANPSGMVLPNTTNPAVLVGQVNQGTLGDCGLVASLAAVVNSDPSWVRDHVMVNANGTVTVVLYDPDGKRVPVTVTADLPTEDGGNYQYVRPTGVGTNLNQSGSSNANWAAYVEKAQAQFHRSGDYRAGTYGSVAGINTSTALHELTGSGRGLDSAGALAAVRSGKAVVVGTPGEWPKGARPTGFHTGHAYTIVSSHQNGTVTLRNPWGTEPNITIPITDLDKYGFNYASN